jgi:hypothetical protein
MSQQLLESRWAEVEFYLRDAKGIAWDTCHKIYVLMDDQQVELMRGYEYDPLITNATPAEMLATLKSWFDQSCPLRFIDAVESVEGDPNLGFTTLIGQFDNVQEEEEEEEEDSE